MPRWLSDINDWIDSIPRKTVRAGLEWVDKVITDTSTHNIPTEDGYEHITSDCPCGPWIERCTTDGRLDWIVQHHHMDGSDAQFVEESEED